MRFNFLGLLSAAFNPFCCWNSYYTDSLTYDPLMNAPSLWMTQPIPYYLTDFGLFHNECANMNMCNSFYNMNMQTPMQVHSFGWENPCPGLLNSNCTNNTPTKAGNKVTESDKLETNETANLKDVATKKSITTGGYSISKNYVKFSNGVIHYKYDDCAAANLNKIENKYLTPSKKSSGIELHKDAYSAFKEMEAAAKKDGVTLTITSAYRSMKTQKTLFDQSGKLTTEAQLLNHAKSSAPPGFSEHHTGLAIDFGNGSGFITKNGKEAEWLKEHAKEYGFEQSFPAENAQGLDEEPWHWRYVGKNHEYDEVFKHAIAGDKKMLENRYK